jgi:hypothetical protein
MKYPISYLKNGKDASRKDKLLVITLGITCFVVLSIISYVVYF